MNIYISHSTKIDYEDLIYKKIRNYDELSKYSIILPHEKNKNITNKREDYKNIDIFIAECTETSIGMGIELGWAYDDNIKIYCIYKKGAHIGNSLKAITNKFIEYEDICDVILKIIKDN